MGLDADSFLEPEKCDLGLRLIIDPQSVDAAHLDADFIGIERRRRSLANPFLHELEKVAIDLKKLLDEVEIADSGQRLAEAYPNLSRQETLPVGDTFARGIELALGHLSTSCPATKG